MHPFWVQHFEMMFLWLADAAASGQRRSIDEPNYSRLVAINACAAFQHMLKSDDAYREAIFTDEKRYSPEWERNWLICLEAWLSLASGLLPGLSPEFVAGYPSIVAEFKQAIRQAESILTPDDKFFASDRLAELRDRAIDNHRAGKTEEMV